MAGGRPPVFTPEMEQFIRLNPEMSHKDMAEAISLKFMVKRAESQVKQYRNRNHLSKKKSPFIIEDIEPDKRIVVHGAVTIHRCL